MSMNVTVRVHNSSGSHTLAGVLVEGGGEASASFGAALSGPGAHLLLGGDRDYHVSLDEALSADAIDVLRERVGGRVSINFVGRRGTYRQRLVALGGALLVAPPETPAADAPAEDAEDASAAAEAAGSLHLSSTIYGANPLYLLADGTLSATPAGPAPTGMDALEAMVTAARWVSSRRTSSFERLFPASAFHPDMPIREERLSVVQAGALLGQIESVLNAASIDAEDPDELALDRSQLRSACVTVLAHVIATAAKDPEFRAPADRATAMVFSLIEAEQGDAARPELRAHAIQLLSQRGPALTDAQQAEVRALLQNLRRQAPPYDEITGPWRFALCSGYEFHKGGVEVLKRQYKFTEVEAPEGTPKPPGSFSRGYTVLEAPFRGPAGQVIQIFARAASPRDENREMESEFFTGIAVNRHANLGSADMKAALVDIRQRGYKLMLNAQCAGLTTRFAISRMFPEADIYSSWDSTYFRTGADGELSSSEGIDCFIAVLTGMSAAEDFAAIDARLKDAQWYHSQSRQKDFVQFIGPAHPLVSRRYEDVNRDGKADYYDGFLDLRLVEIAEDLHGSALPRDPGAAPSQISGAAASGLGWAAGSLNRVTQYSELWDELPGQTELFYAFRSGGFYSHKVPPQDVGVGKGPAVDVGTLPAVCRYLSQEEGGAGIAGEVMLHSWLSHAAQELKRLLSAADAYWRAIDLGYLGGRAPLDTVAGQRAGLLLTLAGLLEFPADQNMIDALWGMSLDMLNLPKISRSLVRRAINDEDHNQGNYYGSRRGVRELLGSGEEPGTIEKSDPVAYAALLADDPSIGRAKPLDFDGGGAGPA